MLVLGLGFGGFRVGSGLIVTGWWGFVLASLRVKTVRVP